MFYFYLLSDSYGEKEILNGTAKYLIIDSNEDLWYCIPLENKIVRVKYD